MADLLDIAPDQVNQLTWEQLINQSTQSTQQTGASNGVSSSNGLVVTPSGNVSPIANNIQSPNFVQGQMGWRLYSNGDFEGNDGVFRGTLTANDGVIGGWTIGTTTLYNTEMILDAANNKITVGSSDGITIDGANKKIESSNYLAGSTGFTISPTLIEAENIIARGTIRGASFTYDQVSAIGGQLMVTNADVLNSDMTALDASTMTVRGDSTFAVNDILLIRAIATSGIQEEWFRVTNIGSAPTYTVTRDLKGDYSANANPAWQAGTPVVKQGKSDGASTYSGGWLKLIGEGTNAPHYSVFARTGVAYNAWTERVRMGNLNGIGGNTSDVYGFFAGDSTQYFMWDGNEISATGFSLNIIKTAGETISGATTPAPVFIRENRDIATHSIIQNYLGGSTANVYGANWYCYSFRLDMYTNNVDKLRIRLEKSGTPSGNFNVALYAADVNYKPTGAAIETESKVADTLVNDWYEFSFSNNNLTPNGLYSLVFSVPNGDISNYVKFYYDDGWEWTYIAGGGASTDSGSTWATIDHAWTPQAMIYGSYTSAKTLGRAYLSQGDDLNDLVFTGFAVSTANVNEEITIQIDGIVNGFTGLTAGAKYFIQDNGTIGTSTGTYDRYVGYAVSTTQLYIDKNDFNFGYRPSAIEKIGLNTENGSGGSPASKSKEVLMYYSGRVIVSFEIKSAASTGSYATFQLYRNGTAAGFLWEASLSTGAGWEETFGLFGNTYTTVWERIDVVAGDLLQLYTEGLGGDGGYVKNFKVYFEYGTLDYKKYLD